MKTFIEPPSNRILVIDDNPAIHEDFRKILCGSKLLSPALANIEAALFEESLPASGQVLFEIDSALQGQDGLALVEKAMAEGRAYAMAFVDIRMPPGWDGVETITRLWKVDPELQVVICTAYSDYSWDDISRKLGTCDNMVILKKPFDNIEVLQLAHALTKKWLLAKKDKFRLEDLDRMVGQRTLELSEANARLEREIAVHAETEAALKVSEQLFEKAFTASPMPMAIQTVQDQSFINVNASFLRLTGLRRENIIGRSPVILPFGFDPETESHLAHRLHQKLPVAGWKGQLRLPSGETRSILLSVEWLNLQSQPHILMLVEDVTERLRLENQLGQAQKMKAVGQLAAGIAHDFNNLLTIIQGHVNLHLAQSSFHPDMAESLREISNAADRAGRLTRQLLAFSRQQVMQRQAVDLNHLLEQRHPMLTQLLGEPITLRYDLTSELPSIFADPGGVEQVLINLALNARDAMPEGGTLALATSLLEIDPDYTRHNPEASVGRFICLQVQDTGCGMDAATQRRIFEPFFTTKEVGKGTGMGMATAHGILKQHGGWIEVSSQLGRGTLFKVIFPVCDGQPQVQPVPKTADLKSSDKNRSILVVEDEPALRELVRILLQRHGYRVLTARNGVDALEVWKNSPDKIDLLLTDMVMPEGISGRKLAELLLQENAQLKVLFSSGYDEGLLQNHQEVPNGSHFLPKPYPPRKLIETVRACLGESK